MKNKIRLPDGLSRLRAGASLIILLGLCTSLISCTVKQSPPPEVSLESPSPSTSLAMTSTLPIQRLSPTVLPQDNTSPESGFSANEILQRFIDDLSDIDIVNAKIAAEQYLVDSPNGVITVTFDVEMRRIEMWNNYGDGLGGDLNQPKFSSGNLAVFNVDTKRYGDSDSIALGRINADSEWKVLDYGR